MLRPALPNISGLVLDDWALADSVPFYDASGTDINRGTVERLGGFIWPARCDGRLTTESGVAISTSDRSSQGTIYFTLYSGNRVSIYDGTRWKEYAFTERSLALTVTSGNNYDVFIYDNAGTLTLELSAAWTNDTTRADALTTQDGVYVKSGATTRRWLGTVRASGANVTEDSASKRFVWNWLNRIPRKLIKLVTSGSPWTYATASWRAMQNDTAHRVELVQGLPGLVELQSFALIEYEQGHYGHVGIKEDNTNGNDADATVRAGIVSTSMELQTCVFSLLSGAATLGYHFYQATEFVDILTSGSISFYAADGSNRFSAGLKGWVIA